MDDASGINVLKQIPKELTGYTGLVRVTRHLFFSVSVVIMETVLLSYCKG
jgi:hypothetical protein